MKTCTTCTMRYPDDATICFVDGGALVDVPDPRIGTLIAGRYVLEEVIGEGGMATVYRARHKLLDRPVAVKIMNPILATDAVVRERFRREARNAQKLAHPNIIEIYDQGDTEESCYLAMELLDGETLASVVRGQPLSVDRAVRAMIQIARGIARAHDFEVTHRDIKPENIFLCQRDDGTELVKILDFGIALSKSDSRLTNDGELFGTPQYMAPERITGSSESNTGAPTDLYALGVVFYEMLTGRLPFDATDIATFFVKHLNEPPPSVRATNPLVPDVLEDLVLRMLAKSPHDRPDAHRVHQDLLDVLQMRRLTAPPKADRETQNAPMSITLDASASDPWTRRVVVLDRMLSQAYGKKQLAPAELTRVLDELQELTRRANALRAESIDAQRTLEAIDARGRERRTQLGFAVDQLGVDASRAREELRSAQGAQKQAEAEVATARQKWLETQREIFVWEGRSGFAEPWPELAEAYRAAADAVDAWRVAREGERLAEAKADATRQMADDLDFQIFELRSALAKHEQIFDDERDKARRRIEELGRETTSLEPRLVELTSRFCEPLRARPDLAPLFKELETQAA